MADQLQKTYKDPHHLSTTSSSTSPTWVVGTGSCLWWLPITFSVNPARKLPEDQPISVILALNRESLLFDPINWCQLKLDLLDWAKMYCPLLKINELTDHLFSERITLSHK